MEESLGLFRIILLSEYFRSASIILFLNKTDLFAERLLDKPIRCIYPEFHGNYEVAFRQRCVACFFFLSTSFVGADDDVESAKEFIKNKYLSLVPPKEGAGEKTIYPHFTCSVGKHVSRSTFYLSMNLFSIIFR